MNRNRKIILGVLIVAILGSTAAACGHGHHHAHNPERAKKFVSYKVDRVLSDIDATASQEAEVHRVKDHLFAEFEAAHAGSDSTHKQILAEWSSAKPDAKRLHELADQRVAAYQKVIHEAVDGMVRVHQVLSPAQRNEIAEHLEKRMH